MSTEKGERDNMECWYLANGQHTANHWCYKTRLKSDIVLDRESTPFLLKIFFEDFQYFFKILFKAFQVFHDVQISNKNNSKVKTAPLLYFRLVHE